MNGLVLAAYVLQFLVPLLLIAVVGLGRSPATRWWDTAVAGAYLVAIAVAGLWLALPRASVWIWLALLVGVAAVRLRSDARPVPSSGARRLRLGLALRGAAILVLLGLTGWAALGRGIPRLPVVDLAFPLAEGTYLAAAAGSNELVNPHVKTLTDERYTSYRGQSYGVDLVAVGAWGSRTRLSLGREPADFAIFGHRIRAPCQGRVVVARDGLPDRLGEAVDRSELEGNHVILECQDHWVILAHMLEGSVSVRPGDQVRVGEPLGRVGNSGQSGEPHLHVHAQSPGTEAEPLSGDPRPITFDGTYLVRNDRIHGMQLVPPTRSTTTRK